MLSVKALAAVGLLSFIECQGLEGKRFWKKGRKMAKLLLLLMLIIIPTQQVSSEEIKETFHLSSWLLQTVYSDQGVVCFFRCRDAYCEDLNTKMSVFWPPVNFLISTALDKFEGCLEKCPPVKEVEALGLIWDPKHFVKHFMFKCNAKLSSCGEDCVKYMFVILGCIVYTLLTAFVVVKYFS